MGREFSSSKLASFCEHMVLILTTTVSSFYKEKLNKLLWWSQRRRASMKAVCSSSSRTSLDLRGISKTSILPHSNELILNWRNFLFRYKEPIELLNQRVEALNTLRTEKLNRVKLVEKEKDELEGPKNEAMAYIKLENELAQSRYSLQQVCLVPYYILPIYLWNIFSI